MVIILDAKDFEISYQLTHQLREFQVSRLSAMGFSVGDLNCLLETLERVRANVNQNTWVEIGIDERLSDGSITLPALEPEVYRDGFPILRIHAKLPRHIILHLYTLIHFIVNSVGTQELYYRTGYSFEEIDNASRQFVMDPEG